MKKKKINKNIDLKKSKGKSTHKSKIKKEVKEIEKIKIEIPKKPKIIRIKTELLHDNPSQANETIVKSLVDKIITLSIRNSYLNTINKSLEDYYFEFLKNQVNNLFATNNIFYYDEPENEQLNKKDLFWNKKYEKGNTWIEISEPNASKCDRYENAFMNYFNYNYNSSSLLPSLSGPILNKANSVSEGNNLKSKDDLIELKDRKLFKKFSMNIRGIKHKESNQKVLDTLEEKSSLSSIDEEKNDIKNPNNKTKNNSIIKSKSTYSPKKENNNKSIFSNINNNKNINNNSNSPNKKPKKDPVLEMKNKEIPGIEKEYNFEKYDPPDVKLLRKEKQDEIIRKEIEERKNAKIKKLVNSSKNENTDNFIDTKTKIKMFDSNKFSFDSNGKIINFKPIKIDSFIKDFVSLKNEIKSMDNTVKIKKIKKIKNNNNDNSPNKSNISTNRKEKIIKNPEDDPNGINKHNYVKKNIEKNEQIIPSGSNFSIMLPNIGVILKEDEQIKEGTREFGKYFKKYSLNDYDKILRDYVPLQNKTMLKNKMNQSLNLNMTTSKRIPKKYMINTNNSFKMNSNTNINNLTIGNNNNLLLSSQTQTNNIYNIPEISNPLINQVETIQENGNNSYNNINNEFNLNSNNNSSLFKTFKSNKNQSSLLNSNSTPFSLAKNGSYDNLLGIIKLNKNSSSLKNELDSLKDLDDKDNLNFYPVKENMGKFSRNIFTNNYKDLLKEKKKQNESSISNNLNEFNKKILSTKGWGNKTLSKNMSTGNLLFSKHQTRYQALRELGSNLLNGIKVKLPRDRKVDIKI